MIKFNKKIFGGYSVKEVDEKLNQLLKSLDVEKIKLNKQINDLLQENIELTKNNSLLQEELDQLIEEKKKLEISNNNYKATLIRQINNISKNSSFNSHSNNRKKVVLKYKEEKPM